MVTIQNCLDTNKTSCVSVIIPNYNGYSYLERCLTSVLRQSYQNIEIIFVDNASVDQSCQFVKEKFPTIRIIQNSYNLGFSGGVNTGIRVSKGEYIFTLNTDTELDPDCITFLVHELEKFPEVGLCGPKLLFFQGGINSTGMCYSRGGKAWDRGLGEEDRGQFDRPEKRDVMGVCAGAALYRMTMLREIGLFDEDFFLIFEDYDLSIRAYLSGWKSRYVHNARVFHVRGGTMEPTSSLSVFYGERNKVWVPLKNYPLTTLILYFPFIIIENLSSLGYWIKKGKGKSALQGKMAALSGLCTILRKRRDIKRVCTISFQNDC